MAFSDDDDKVVYADYHREQVEWRDKAIAELRRRLVTALDRCRCHDREQRCSWCEDDVTFLTPSPRR